MAFEVIRADQKILAGTDAWNTGLLVDQGLSNVVRSGFTGWSVSVKDVETHTVVYTRTEVSNADIAGIFLFFDTLQTDGYWGKNALGYNYRHNVRAADLTGAAELKAGRDYLFTYSFTTASFGVLKQQYLWEIKPGG